MPILFKCCRCTKPLHAREQDAGMQARCPSFVQETAVSMSTALGRTGLLVLIAFVILGTCGCKGRVPVKAAKASAKEIEELAEFKDVQDFIRDKASDAAKQWLKDQAKPQPSLRERLWEDAERRKANRFPHPVASVQPVPGGERIEKPKLGIYGLPNNFGGYSIYRLSDNVFVGFTAFHEPTGAMHHFDAFGNRLK
jgi:hypothetical protein